MEPKQSEGQIYRPIVLGQQQNERFPTRLLLVLEAYLSLIRFEVHLAREDFDSLYKKVRNYPIRNKAASPDTLERICSALDMACIWYRNEVLCLQRSAAATCLLRKYGISAHLVIGTQQMPFKAHAWVEVGGRVVNDKEYVHELYARLDQC
jgi:hypothetical protein